MKRALRRYQRRKIHVRRLRYLWNTSRWHGREQLLECPWKCLNRYRYWVWSTPSWWITEIMTRPARAKSRTLLRKIEREVIDAEGLNWPDYRRPHIYFW